MAKNRYQYSRGPVDAVALLIVFAWIAIWVLWDRGEPDLRGRGIAPTRIVYVAERALDALEDELMFIARHDAAVTGAREERIVSASIGIPSRPRFLDAPLVKNGKNLSDLKRALGDSVASTMKTYAPAWPDSDMYRSDAGQEGLFLVAMSQRLQDCGFELPINLFDGVGDVDASWQARVHVDCSVDGRPRHVFLEEASENKEINGWLVRTMYQATLSVTGATCSGWITVGQRK